MLKSESANKTSNELSMGSDLKIEWDCYNGRCFKLSNYSLGQDFMFCSNTPNDFLTNCTVNLQEIEVYQIEEINNLNR